LERYNPYYFVFYAGVSPFIGRKRKRSGCFFVGVKKIIIIFVAYFQETINGNKEQWQQV
jgi:hypothetical protein